VVVASWLDKMFLRPIIDKANPPFVNW